MPFGKRLKEARLAKRMTQEELANAIGVTKGAIGNYESEVSSPKEPILILLMKVLGVDANFLYQDFINSNEVYSTEEQQFLSAYRTADAGTKRSVRKLLDLDDASIGSPRTNAESGQTA